MLLSFEEAERFFFFGGGDPTNFRNREKRGISVPGITTFRSVPLQYVVKLSAQITFVLLPMVAYCCLRLGFPLSFYLTQT